MERSWEQEEGDEGYEFAEEGKDFSDEGEEGEDEVGEEESEGWGAEAKDLGFGQSGQGVVRGVSGGCGRGIGIERTGGQGVVNLLTYGEDGWIGTPDFQARVGYPLLLTNAWKQGVS